MILGELRSYFYCESEFIARVLINEGIKAERGRVFTINAIVHHEELSIRWIDRHSLHSFKIARINTLMEITVVENDAALRSLCVPAHSEIIVEDES